jgi:hypothetical protein
MKKGLILLNFLILSGPSEEDEVIHYQPLGLNQNSASLIIM